MKYFYRFIFLVLVLALTGCFESGPSDEELFAQAAAQMKKNKADHKALANKTVNDVAKKDSAKVDPKKVDPKLDSKIDAKLDAKLNATKDPKLESKPDAKPDAKTAVTDTKNIQNMNQNLASKNDVPKNNVSIKDESKKDESKNSDSQNTLNHKNNIAQQDTINKEPPPIEATPNSAIVVANNSNVAPKSNDMPPPTPLTKVSSHMSPTLIPTVPPQIAPTAIQTITQSTTPTPSPTPTPLPPKIEVLGENNKNTSPLTATNNSATVRLDLTQAMVVNEIGAGGGKNFAGAKALIDEQRVAGDPLSNKGNSGFSTSWSEAARLNKELDFQKGMLSSIIDLGKYYELTSVYLFSGNNLITIYGGGPVNNWVQIGQLQLSAGQWNNIPIQTKLNTRYLRISIDALNPDVIGPNKVAASSGDEIVLYGKPLDTRTPAGKPEPQSVLKPPLWQDFLGINVTLNDPLKNEFIQGPEMSSKYQMYYPKGPMGFDEFSKVRVQIKTPWLLSHHDPFNNNWFLRFGQLSIDNTPVDLDYFLKKINENVATFSTQKKEITLALDYSIPSVFPDRIKAEMTSKNLWKQNNKGQYQYPWEQGHVKPISSKEKFVGKTAADFLDESQLYFQIGQRYGSLEVPKSATSMSSASPTTTSTNDINAINNKDYFSKVAPDQKIVSGLRSIASLEGRPHPDRYWGDTCPECTFFAPKEYATYLSALFDGAEKTLGNFAGSKQADPAMKISLGTLSIPSIDYPLMIKLWAEENRTNGQLPFDQLSYQYFPRRSGKAVFPENSPLYETFKNLVNDRNMYFADKPLWVTEFGYDSSSTSSMGVTVPAGSTEEMTQGIWLMRGLLLFSATGVDRVYLHSFSDHASKKEDESQPLHSAGLIKSQSQNFLEKSSYYLITTLNKELTNTRLKNIVDPMEESKGNQDAICLQYASDDDQKIIYVLWTPTNNGPNHRLSQYSLKLPENLYTLKAEQVHLVRPDGKTTEGERTPASLTSDHQVMVDVGEMPVFIEINR